jgi:hypothetical protein
MHQRETVAQVILILFIVDLALTAPAVQDIHETRDDVIVRVLAEDVGAVARKRGNGAIHGHTIPWEPEDSDSESDDKGYETASDEPSDDSSVSDDSESFDALSTSTEPAPEQDNDPT